MLEQLALLISEDKMHRIEINVQTNEKKVIPLTADEIADAEARTAQEKQERLIAEREQLIQKRMNEIIREQAEADVDAKLARGAKL